MVTRLLPIKLKIKGINMSIKKIIIILLLMLFFLGSVYAGSTKKVSVLYVKISGTINPVQLDLLKEGLSYAESNNFDIIMIGLNTPGGLAKTMRDMVQVILNSNLPVVVWVGPKGAQAASAGVFLVAAADIAAMAPHTSIGSASPVAIGGKDVPETMQKKIKNDLMSLIRSMTRSKNRNYLWYERAIEESASLSAEEAVINKVVDLIAVSPHDLMVQLGKRGIFLENSVVKFSEDEFSIKEFEPSLRYKFLAWLLNPEIAYLLLLGGVAGLFFELSHPGVIFPGVFGGICLLMALYALSILPTNVAGLLLILFGLVLFILELKIVSYGLLTVGGLICMFFGSIILFRFERGVEPIPLSTILPSLIIIGLLVLMVMYLVTKVQLKPKTLGIEGMIGSLGEVIEWSENRGKVKIRGEIWNAETTRGNTNLEKGTKVKVVGNIGLTLIVEPQN